MTTVTDGVMYLLGPFLILLASGIIVFMTYAYFTVLLPMLESHISLKWVLHVSYVVFILMNIIFNYALCVFTSNKGEQYNRVVRELAIASDFEYPEVRDNLCMQKFEDTIHQYYYIFTVRQKTK